MPMPWTYRHASREWRAFLDDVKDGMNLSSDNMAYTAVDGVFQCYRRRLTAAQGLGFASVLPCVPRAIFVAGWQPTDPLPEFPSRAELVAEVKALRPHHNLTPDTAIEATAIALQRQILPDDWARALAALPPDARAFWDVPDMPESELRPRII
ncbi:hypothetical protein ROE7235_01333 [Roseibaca ekhonensis]|uniref:DUF2267 domain-containing protein n=1 Tax=Roseinatronobacter ekhonensis TaxID=254356 RepID=A0A3B0MRU8_9RHOB|nr:DUF2267 domain-containing protein [Roseibaca ekhonensis]SUZ31584.1 hypothetical protein ROE7235_01333 [Roseibaca ekhonensis]